MTVLEDLTAVDWAAEAVRVGGAAGSGAVDIVVVTEPVGPDHT